MPAPTCPETVGRSGRPVAASTAYQDYGCRCDTCREWKAHDRTGGELDTETPRDGDGTFASTALTMARDNAIERAGADAVYGMVAAGQSMAEIARELGLPDDTKSRWAVRAWLRRDPERYAEAKQASAESLAEKAGEVYGEKAPATTADAKWRHDRSGYFRWLAEQRDPSLRPAGVEVNLDFGQLHLEALRKHGSLPVSTEPLRAEVVVEDDADEGEPWD